MIIPLRDGRDPAAMDPAETFYAESLRRLVDTGVRFLLAGTYAVAAYTGIRRPTKDLDVFCKAGDYPRIAARFQDQGYAVEIEDERWIAKVRRGSHFFDVIFNSSAGIMPVTDSWFADARTLSVYGVEVEILAPTELVWSKCFIQNRERYDGADVAHVILKQHEAIDWQRLLSYMEPYWEVLLMHLLNFRFIYPSERDRVPRWLLDELADRLAAQAKLPAPQLATCRGRLFSPHDYAIDITEWGFADVVGKCER
jgi:predicted nucleotidyltransferase